MTQAGQDDERRSPGTLLADLMEANEEFDAAAKRIAELNEALAPLFPPGSSRLLTICRRYDYRGSTYRVEGDSRGIVISPVEITTASSLEWPEPEPEQEPRDAPEAPPWAERLVIDPAVSRSWPVVRGTALTTRFVVVVLRRANFDHRAAAEQVGGLAAEDAEACVAYETAHARGEDPARWVASLSDARAFPAEGAEFGPRPVVAVDRDGDGESDPGGVPGLRAIHTR